MVAEKWHFTSKKWHFTSKKWHFTSKKWHFTTVKCHLRKIGEVFAAFYIVLPEKGEGTLFG